jgi:hypothetical protein
LSVSDDRGTQPWRTLWVKPPAPGSPRHERLRFIRDLELRLSIYYLPLGLIAVLSGEAWLRLVLAICFGWSLLHLLYLTWAVARGPRRTQVPPT